MRILRSVHHASGTYTDQSRDDIARNLGPRVEKPRLAHLARLRRVRRALGLKHEPRRLGDHGTAVGASVQVLFDGLLGGCRQFSVDEGEDHFVR
jgi:hypothetical protein